MGVGPARSLVTTEFADFPEIITSGDTLAEAFANACKALDSAVGGVCDPAIEPPASQRPATKAGEVHNTL
jgi:predicted RNase H-like HicB family nuclease